VDNAVALVQAYMRVNGYFTVSEFPVIEFRRREGYAAATDLDILAYRFPGAGRIVPQRGRSPGADQSHFAPDPVLGISAHQPDMIIGEVKEGRAVLNAGATDPAVLRAVLVRFGCPPGDAPRLAEALLREGATTLGGGHRLRMVAFGSVIETSEAARYERISLGHILGFLQTYLREHWEVLRHEDPKDPALGFLSLLQKCAEADK
jgi:hypothetical protein